MYGQTDKVNVIVKSSSQTRKKQFYTPLMPVNTEEEGQKRRLIDFLHNKCPQTKKSADKNGDYCSTTGRMIHWDAKAEHMQNLVKAALTFSISMHLNFHRNQMFTFQRVELTLV